MLHDDAAVYSLQLLVDLIGILHLAAVGAVGLHCLHQLRKALQFAMWPAIDLQLAATGLQHCLTNAKCLGRLCHGQVKQLQEGVTYCCRFSEPEKGDLKLLRELHHAIPPGSTLLMQQHRQSFQTCTAPQSAVRDADYTDRQVLSTSGAPPARRPSGWHLSCLLVGQGC